jgi:MFS superfamily sulfate permease-like transporter
LNGFSDYAGYAEAIARRNFAMIGALVIVAIPLAILYYVQRWRPRIARALSWIYVGVFYASLVILAFYSRV